MKKIVFALAAVVLTLAACDKTINNVPEKDYSKVTVRLDVTRPEALTKANELGEANAAKLLSSAYLREGQALLKAGKNLEAVAALEKSNSYAESANAYKLIASAYTKSGKSAQAIEAYKKYLEVSPNAKDADDILFTIAATAQKAGDKATAKEYYGKLTGSAKYAAQAAAQLKTL